MAAADPPDLSSEQFSITVKTCVGNEILVTKGKEQHCVLVCDWNNGEINYDGPGACTHKENLCEVYYFFSIESNSCE